MNFFEREIEAAPEWARFILADQARALKRLFA
jgi:hypothetical protein